jgi:NNP family nitrate/nitrite transporter-like MFS transporter
MSMTRDQLLYGVFPYVAIIVAVVGTIWRYFDNRFSFSSLSSQFLEDRRLFWGSMPWHYGILVVLIGHLVGLLIPGWVLAWNGVPWRLYVLEATGLIFGLLALVGLVLLMIRRARNARIRAVTSVMDWVLLLTLLVQVIAGVWTAIFYRWGSSWYAGFAVPYLWSILTLSPNVALVNNMPFMVQTHIIGGFALVLLLPFTRLVHLLSFPFTYLWRPHQVVIWNRSPRPTAQQTPRAATLALTMGTLAFAVSFAAWSLLAPLAAGIQRDLGLSEMQISILIAVPVILGALMRIPLGIMTDRYGGRRIFTLLMLLVIPGVLILSQSDSYPALLIGGFWLGLAGASFAVGVPFVSRHYPPERQGFALGVYGIGNIGTAIAARAAPQISADWGRPAVFYVFAGILAIMALVFWLLARDVPTLDGAARPTPTASLNVLREEPLAWLLSLFYFVTFGGFVAFSLYLPKLLVDLYQITPIDAGNRVLVFVLLATLARPIGGWLADRMGGVRVLLIVFSIAAAAGLLLTLTTSLIPLTIACLTAAWFFGMGNGAVFKLVPQYFPDRTGAVTGIVGAAGGLGGFFPPLIMGAVHQSLGSYALGFALLSLTALLCLALDQFVLNRKGVAERLMHAGT